MLTPFRDYREPRDWRRPWVDAPGWWPCCCGGASESMLAAGGAKSGSSVIDDAELYDTQANSWTVESDLPSPARNQTQGFGGIGRCYVACGYDAGTGIGDCDEYSGGSWTSRTTAPSPVRWGGAQGSIGEFSYTAAGINSTDRLYDTDEYDHDGDSWASMSDCPAPPRYSDGSGNGSTDGTYLYMSFGYGAVPPAPGVRLQDHDRFDPSGDSWTSLTDGSTPARRGNAMCHLGGYLYSAGADAAGIATTDHDRYDIGGDSWSAKTNLSAGKQDMNACESAVNSAYYLLGGNNLLGTFYDNLDEYVEDTFTVKQDISFAHSAMAFARISSA